MRPCQWPVANMHAEPRGDCEVVSQVVYATNVEVLDQNGDWMKVRTPDQYEGWVREDALAEVPQIRIMIATQMTRVKNLFAHVYRASDLSAGPPIMTLPYGVPVEVVTSVNDRWVMVWLVDGRWVYMQRGDLDFDPQVLTLDEALTVGCSFEGLPYTWGGVSTFGFDCSGLVQMLYGMTGIQLPRDARQQIAMEGMTPIQLAELQRGDFIFFGYGDGRTTHVALYLGNNQFLHASARSGNPIVQMSDLTDPKWRQIYPDWSPARLIR